MFDIIFKEKGVILRGEDCTTEGSYFNHSKREKIIKIFWPDIL